MQDNNEWFTWLFIVEKEAPKGSLYKKRDRELITKEVSLIKKKCNVKCSFAQQDRTRAWHACQAVT